MQPISFSPDYSKNLAAWCYQEISRDQSSLTIPRTSIWWLISLERDLFGLWGSGVTKGVIWIREGEAQKHTTEQHISLTALGGCAKSGYAAGGTIC